jgi:hypothetical protein
MLSVGPRARHFSPSQNIPTESVMYITDNTPLNELTITIGGRLTCHQKVCRSRCHARRQPNGSRGDDPRSILVLEPDLTIRFANCSFCHTFAVAPEHTVRRKLYEIGNGQWGSRAFLPVNRPAHNGAQRAHGLELKSARTASISLPSIAFPLG